MKRLLVVILVAAGLWAGYWFVGAAGVRAGFAAWFDGQRAAGWQAEYSDMQVRGFPNRFDTTFADLRLADPATGWAWEAPFFQIFALSYQPGHVIAIWPPEHRLSTPLQKFSLTSASMQASVRLGASTALPLQRANLVADTFGITDEAGNTTSMTALRMAVERLDGAEARYHFGIVADDLAPARAARLALDGSGNLPRTFGAFRADMEADFTRPWDLSAIERDRPQPTRIKLRLAEARWGDLELALAGEVTVDEQGRPDGQMVLKARNWREIVAMGVASGAIPAGLADQMVSGLGLLAQMSGNPDTLDLPIDFARGRMSVGLIPLGPAPVIRLR